MDFLLQIGLGAAALCVAAIGLRRRSRRDGSAPIEVGAVSPGWLADHTARRRD